jgi:DNA modification methylase
MALLLRGDACEILTILPDCSVNCCATSPPYWMQRDYGVAGQIGREDSIEKYLQRLWAVFDEVRRVLTRDGTCWVNLGDKYQDNCAQLIPEQFAIGMKKRGWILRGKIIWHKKTGMESVKSRFTNNWEPVYHFSKSKQHYFALQYEPYSPETLARCHRFLKNKEAFDPARHKQDKHAPEQAPFRLMERFVKNLCVPGRTPNGIHIKRAQGLRQDVFDNRGRQMRSVWNLPTAQFRGAHFAAWPVPLVARMVRAGCPKGGIVLDPFVGSGTTLIVAENEGCTGIGIDLQDDYLELAAERVLESRAKRVNPKAALLSSRQQIHIDCTHDEFVEL